MPARHYFADPITDAGRRGPGIFLRLQDLKPGTRIFIFGWDHTTARFVVYRTEEVSKAKFTTQKVCGPTTRPELRLVTCAGRYDSQQGYEDNLIVYAVLST